MAALTIPVIYILEPASPYRLNWEVHTRYHLQKRSPKILSKYVAAWSMKAKVLSVISPVPTSRLYFKAAHVFDKVLSKLLFKVPLVGRRRRASEESLEIPHENSKLLKKNSSNRDRQEKVKISPENPQSTSRVKRSPKKVLWPFPTPRLFNAFRKKLVIVGRKKRSFWRR